MSFSRVSSAEAIALPSVKAEKWVLPNGLTLLVHEDHRHPVASVQFWVETGSIHEGVHLGAGVSHLLEHMLFKGTEHRTCSEFAQRVQDAGGYLNAYTSFDRTVYWIDIPAKGVEVALELLADAVLHSTLPAEEFVKEQEVIRREFAMGFDDPDRMSGQALFAAAYRSHPYRFPVIGHLDAFNRLTRDDTMAYYKTRYVPNNMYVIVAGDVDPARIHARVVEWCGSAPYAALPPVFIAPEPKQYGRRDDHREFATELTRLHLAWHTPDAAHADIPALDLAASILGSGRSARLYRSLREEARLVHSIEAWCYAPGQPGLWGVDALLDPDKREAVEAEVLAALETLRREGPTEAELAKARRQSLASQFGTLTTMRGRASEMGANWLLTRNLDFSKAYLEAVQAVTREELQRVVAQYLRPENLTAVSLSPEGSLPPLRTTPEASAAREIRRFELPNGLRLLVREDPRLPLVSMTAVFKGGLLGETPATNGVSRLLARTLLKGTTTRTAEQLADEIEAAGGSISSDAGNNSLSVFVRVLRPDCRLGLEILSDVLRNATLPEKAIAREKEVQLAAIKAEEEEVTAVARQLLREQLLPGHPYGLRHLGTPESVAALTQTHLRQYRDRHLAGRNGVISVFGDVRAEEVLEEVQRALGDLPAGAPALAEIAVPAPLPEPRQVETEREKAQAILMVGFLGSDIYSPDRAALELIDEASSDLGSRFFIRIREQMGLAYFVGTSHMLGLVRSPFVFYLGTDPLKLTAVQAEFMSEIRQLAREGLTEVELARAKEKLLGQQEIRLQSNDSFGFSCALDELYGLGFDHYRHARPEIEAVTLEEVRRVAHRYFGEQAPLTAIVRPAGAGAAEA